MFKRSTAAIGSEPPGFGEFMSRAGLATLLGILLALAIPTGLVAFMQGSGALLLPFNLHMVDQQLPGIFRLHMLTSGVSLLLIPAVIFTRRDRAWHKPLGRVAAVCVVAGALTSLPVAIFSESAAMARAGFFAQGIVWLGLLTAGVMAVRARKIQQHAQCMLAMAGVASGAIWVRLTTTAATAWNLPFDPLYSCAAWLGWIVPMVIGWGIARRVH